MKKQQLISIIAIAAISALTLSACGKHKPDTSTDTDMSLSIEGGTKLEVVDGDITKNFKTTCSTPAQEDIIVNIDTGALPTEAELTSKQITIKQGTKTAEGAIKFKLAAFPEKAPVKLILVRISTFTKGVTVDTPTTEFSVSGYVPLTLEAEANGTEFNTFTGNVDYIITFTLSKELETAPKVSLRRKASSSPVFEGQVLEYTDVTIDTKKKTGEAKFTIAQGTEGTLEMEVLSDNPGLEIITTDFSANFIATEEPDPETE